MKLPVLVPVGATIAQAPKPAPRLVANALVSHSLNAPGCIPDEQHREIMPQPEVDASNEDSRVSLSCGFTHPVEQYRTVKINITVSAPCENRPRARLEMIQQLSAEMGHYLKEETEIAINRYYEICGPPQQ